jgi:hypothetical protein
MSKIEQLGLTAAAAFVFATCGGNVLASNANADDTPERTASPRPTKVALLTLEKSAYEAWKSKDAAFWVTFLSDKFVGWGSFGKLDKASATKEYTGADCEIKSYALSDEQLSLLGKDAALITYKATVNGTCGGQQLPTNSPAASIYIRDDGRAAGSSPVVPAIFSSTYKRPRRKSGVRSGPIRASKHDARRFPSNALFSTDY